MRGGGKREHCGCGSPNPWRADDTDRANQWCARQAHGFDHEAFGMIGPFDDFDYQVRHGAGDAVLEDWPAIGTVREQLPQERELSEQGGQQQDTAVAVLNISSRHHHMQHQAECINQDVALLALDQLTGIEAVWIDARPPFSALFTLWLSTIQAVGLASRSACSRHFT